MRSIGGVVQVAYEQSMANAHAIAREMTGLSPVFVMDTFGGRIDAAPASFAQVTNTQNCCHPGQEVHESAPIRVTRVTTTISKGRWHADRLCKVVGGRLSI